MSTPKISLVIPAYNEEKYIGACLDSVIKNSGNLFHEIIVIDNASSDGTATIARERKNIKVVHESKKGLTKARQRGLQEASGDFIAYIDADTLLLEKWVSVLKNTLLTHPEVVCLSGPYRYYDAPKLTNIVLDICWWLSAPITYRIVGYMVLGGNFVAKKSALLEMGGFDTGIDFYGEDTNIARRLSKIGKVMFRMDFFIYSSSRRFLAQGILKTCVTYALNFAWEVLFHRPYTKTAQDIRPPSSNHNQI